MDALQKYVDDNLVSKENILKYVDQFSIYSYYIKAELETRTKYSSPLRQGDEDPSFSIYWSDKYEGVLFFKDNATGKSGDVFKFLRLLMSNGSVVHTRDVLLQINSDFQLGLDGEDVGDFTPLLVKDAPIKKHPVKIEITKHITPTQEFEDYWNELEISQETLKKFYVLNPRVVHYIGDIHKSVVPKTLCISYEILGHYKIYHPYEDKQYKFRNNFLDIYIEGALQLSFTTDFCIITKSTKECIFFYEHFGWESVAGKSETTQINEYFMTSVLQKRFKYVFIWLDSDEAGIAAQNKYLEKYPWLIPIRFYDYIEQKDVTDLFLFAKRSGKRDIALDYIKQLILKHIK